MLLVVGTEVHVTTRARHDLCVLFLFFRKNKYAAHVERNLPVIHVLCRESERERKRIACARVHNVIL